MSIAPATGGQTYPSSSDELSPYYPERLIRPLPKRTIRSRLSSEAAENISYPPNPPSASLPSYSPYDYDHEHVHRHEHDHEHDSYQEDDEHNEDCPHHPDHHCHHDHEHTCHHHDDDEDELDSVDENSPIASRMASRTPRSPELRHGRYNSYDVTSAAPDGYEAFENTNNKKKRKIPTSGSLSLQGSMNSEFAQTGPISREVSLEEQSTYVTSPTGLGVHGAGRGRPGRKSDARRPLGVPVSGNNARLGNGPHHAPVTPEAAKADQGIISKAIANATTLLRNPLGKGQENVGVLEQQLRTTPTNSQFTFTCESESKGVKFPDQPVYHADYTQQSALTQTQSQYYDQNAQYNNTAPQQSLTQGSNNSLPQPAPRRTRRQRRQALLDYADRRKYQQALKNQKSPPGHEDIWICGFCEYESIFGSMPQALVRRYEIRDREARRKRADQKRRLEKSKQNRNRKNKKQTKSAAKAANAASARQDVNGQDYDQPVDQMDDYQDDGYDDDPLPVTDPPPQQVPAKPMPGSYDKGGGTAQTSGASYNPDGHFHKRSRDS